MSLKAFHIVFITLSSGLALGCGVWLLVSSLSAGGMKKDVFFGVSSLIGAVALILMAGIF